MMIPDQKPCVRLATLAGSKSGAVEAALKTTLFLRGCKFKVRARARCRVRRCRRDGRVRWESRRLSMFWPSPVTYPRSRTGRSRALGKHVSRQPRGQRSTDSCMRQRQRYLNYSSNVLPASVDVKEKVARGLFVNAGGLEVMVVSGAFVSIVQSELAGVGSVLPPAIARTLKLWFPTSIWYSSWDSYIRQRQRYLNYTQTCSRPQSR